MKRFFPFLILLLAAVSCTSEQKRVFNIADLGAVDGQVCTRAIQQAMDQCSEAGGYWDNMLIEACEINSSCNGIRIIMPCDGVTIRDSHFYCPGVYPHRTSGEARRNNMLLGVSLEPGKDNRVGRSAAALLCCFC